MTPTKLKCPSCPDSKDNICCSCGCEIPYINLELRPDPFAEEIYGDDRVHLMCTTCFEKSCEDI